MTALASSIAERHPDTNAGWSVTLKPLREELVGETRATLLAAVLLILVLTSANVANLQIARGAAREREMGRHLCLRDYWSRQRHALLRPQGGSTS